MKRRVAEVRSVLVAYQRILSLKLVEEYDQGHTSRRFCCEELGTGLNGKRPRMRQQPKLVN